MYGLENYVEVAVQHSEKTSGEPIREAMRFLGISVIIRSTMAARLSEKRMVLIQRGTAIFAWLATGS